MDVKVVRKGLPTMRVVEVDEKWKRESLVPPHRRKGKGRVEDFRYPYYSKEKANIGLSVYFKEKSCASGALLSFAFATFLDIFQDMLIVFCHIYFAGKQERLFLRWMWNHLFLMLNLEEDEDEHSLSMMEERKHNDVGDTSHTVLIERVCNDLESEGQQLNIASLEVTEGGGEDTSIVAARKSS